MSLGLDLQCLYADIQENRTLPCDLTISDLTHSLPFIIFPALSEVAHSLIHTHSYTTTFFKHNLAILHVFGLLGRHVNIEKICKLHTNRPANQQAFKPATFLLEGATLSATVPPLSQILQIKKTQIPTRTT